MAKTYYSTRPPLTTAVVTPTPYTETPITNVNIPGDYFLSVDQSSGKITLKSGDNTRIESGARITLYATTKNVLIAPDNEVLGNVVLGVNVGQNTLKLDSRLISDILPFESETYSVGEIGNTFEELHFERGTFYDESNVENPFGFEYDPNDVYGAEFLNDDINLANAQRREGAVTFEGGVGIQKDLNVGGWIYGRVRFAQTSLSVLITATNIDFEYYPIFVRNTGQQFLWIDEDGAVEGLTYNPAFGRLTTDRLVVAENDTATDTEAALRVEGGALIKENALILSNVEADETEGALRVEGGISVGENIYVSTDAYVETLVETNEVLPHANLTGNIGLEEQQWYEGYIENFYTRYIKSTTGTIQIAPKDPLTEILGDIRVRGVNPIGTAPVVSNVLYVTVDGNDTNDGRAMDASRACRTIGGALNSPYYQPGTQILVSAGTYYEDNPLRLKPYTSIRGSDIRTTFIEPINKTQDLFHLDSGCYLNYMTFLNGRSGLLEGQYEEGFNRGAYATAFPPLTGEDRIDLFHSPYVQNCTNQSGPWLKDGTMFVPNQTVQVPQAVGTGTWQRNTTSIIVNVSSGTITQGMTINAGQQNPGFFDARTLMLANKPFLQEQVVTYVDRTFNSGSFSYDGADCKRDLGLIVDSIALDLLYNSYSESIFAGLQYWSQGNVSFPGELTTTTGAINYLRSEAVALLAGDPATVTTGLFDEILNILASPSYLVGITDTIVSNGLASTTASYVTSYNTLISSKNTLATNVINWISANHPGFVYNTSTCRRDVGYIIDSVAFDLLHGGNKQSIKSGIYYYDFDPTSSQVPAELPQTAAAYYYLKSIVPSIVKGQVLPKTYQNSSTQVTGLPIAGNYEAEQLQLRLDTITNIIRGGPDEAGPKTPINQTINPSEEALNAWNSLAANKQFIKDEVTAYIDQTSNTFEYSREKCFRDVGILVENVSYDASFGGNQKAVESGLAYYDGVISRISGQEAQTIAAIDYLNSLTQSIITNTTCTDLKAVGLSTTATYVQVRNTVLTGGAIAAESIDNLFNTITGIIANGPDSAPEIYTSPGPDAAYVSAEILMQANRKFIQEDTINYINNILYAGGLAYSERKCRRDTKLIVDAIAQDLLWPTQYFSQSTFAGLQYWSQGNYTGDIEAQLRPTIDAVAYLKNLSVKIIQNITPADDLINRYQTAVSQDTSLESAGIDEANVISADFDIVLEILEGQRTGWTDRIEPNGTATNLSSVINAYELLQANKNYMAAEILAYVDTTHPDFTFNTSTCARDVGLIIDSIAYDLKHGGNRQAIQAGLYYYGYQGSTSTIHGQESATIAAYNRIYSIVGDILTNTPITVSTGNTFIQDVSLSTATISEVNYARRAISTITNIISSGTIAVSNKSGIAMTASSTATVLNAYNILKANRDFIAEEIIAFVDSTYNPNTFNYNEEKCYRDVGLIVDAVSQDILLGGNQKSLEAGLAYWSAGYNYIVGQETTTTMAINHARDIALQVIANTPVTAQTQTETTQVINTFFQYGGDYMPQQAVARNFNIITNIIENGPEIAPPSYLGGGLFALTGLNGADVKIGPKVTSVTTVTTGTYRIGLSTATIGFGFNSTLYFGETLIFPLRDYEVEEQSFEYTGNSGTWNIRKIDQIGSMGGSLVDGAVISDRSPIQSFVYDAFTQVNQGGRGVHIKNDGYAQLVSVFTIFCSIGVEVESGGIASIVNSNANFGNICLQAKGYGKRKFTGHVYNPTFKAYPESPNPALAVTFPDSEYFDQYYPTGFWPNNARVRVFLPDIDDRPHISLVMEVVPPEVVTDFTGSKVSQLNEQGFPGFLNAAINTSTLTTSSITISGIDTTGIAVGNSVYVRDINNSFTGTNGLSYVASGTVVTAIGYQTVTLSKALTSGGSDPVDPTNTEFFNIYFCGNAYYTVLSSEVGNNPEYNRLGQEIPAGVNILSTASTGLATSQVAAHVSSLNRLKQTVIQVINNNTVTNTVGNVSTQTFLPLVRDGGLAETFIEQRFDEMVGIISTATVTQAEAFVPSRLRTTSGPAVQGAGSAITLIRSNIEYLADEISAHVQFTFGYTPEVDYDDAKCQRDVKIILQRLIYDIETGGRYNSVMVGLSYWNRAGTYHIVQLGENVTRTDLFPDGATVNFYQRSYMSASGYVFEYVGAGIDYGALPQRRIADPKQGQEVVMLDSGKVFFTSTDQNGDFRIGPGLVISQATGVLSGRTFTKSLFANMTPFILAIEGGG